MNEGIIRLITTSDCMYNCFFCHREGIKDKRSIMMNVEDIIFLYKIYNKYYGKDEIRISGGEPLMRKDIMDIAKGLYEVGCNTYLTTNGYLLKVKSDICKYLKKINISIHSLNNNKYREITDTNVNVDNIINQIKKIRNEYPKLDIIIDTVLLKSINTDDNIDKLIKISEELEIKIKFVELFLNNKKYLYPLEELETKIKDKGFKKTMTYIRKIKYQRDNAQIYIAKCFCNINQDNQRFSDYCNKYNDLFISPDGRVQLCRLCDKEINILYEIKNRNEKELIGKLDKAYQLLGKNCLVEGGNIWK